MIVNIIVVIVLLISITRYDASLVEMTLMESNDLLSECLSSPSPSSPSSSSNEMIERESFCKRIIHLGDADPNAMHEITISIKQKGSQWIDETLYAVSDPSSKSYGKHLTFDEIVAKTKNTMGSLIVSQWLQRLSNDIHISAKTENEEYITVQAPVHIIEQVFSTKFLKFGYIDTRNDGDRLQSFVSDDTYICALKYSIPTILVDHIEAVFNTVQLPLALISRKKPNLKKKDILESNVNGRKLSLEGLTYPQRISDLYGIFSHEGNTMATQAVFATNDQFYSVEDLSIFKSFFKLPVDKPNRVVGGASREVLGVCTDIDRCGEANLDIQYITSIARSTPTTFWYVKTGTAFSSFLYDALNSRDVPKVISISYAMPEVYLSVSEKRMFDLEVKKLGLRGTTVITSSGDHHHHYHYHYHHHFHFHFHISLYHQVMKEFQVAQAM
jgi:tripeptidyl-peptidase-1